jgi:hypothetical protein
MNDFHVPADAMSGSVRLSAFLVSADHVVQPPSHTEQDPVAAKPMPRSRVGSSRCCSILGQERCSGRMHSVQLAE